MTLKIQPSSTFTTTIQDRYTGATNTLTLPDYDSVLACIDNTASQYYNFGQDQYGPPRLTSAHTANRTIALPDRDCELTDGFKRISDNPEQLINRSLISFTIPEYAKYVCIVYDNISTQYASIPFIRVRTAREIITSGYVSQAGAFRSTARTLLTRNDGFPLTTGGGQTDFFYTGVCELHNLMSDVWTCSAIWKINGPYDVIGQTNGNISLTRKLAAVCLVMSTTGVFETGTANVFYK